MDKLLGRFLYHHQSRTAQTAPLRDLTPSHVELLFQHEGQYVGLLCATCCCGIVLLVL